jgi:hypothetical protein
MKADYRIHAKRVTATRPIAIANKHSLNAKYFASFVMLGFRFLDDVAKSRKIVDKRQQMANSTDKKNVTNWETIESYPTNKKSVQSKRIAAN